MSSKLGPCPYCNQPMLCGDETAAERICDACVAKDVPMNTDKKSITDEDDFDFCNGITWAPETKTIKAGDFNDGIILVTVPTKGQGRGVVYGYDGPGVTIGDVLEIDNFLAWERFQEEANGSFERVYAEGDNADDEGSMVWAEHGDFTVTEIELDGTTGAVYAVLGTIEFRVYSEYHQGTEPRRDQCDAEGCEGEAVTIHDCPADSWKTECGLTVHALTPAEVVKLINDFDKRCEENEETDVQEVWDLFTRIREGLAPPKPAPADILGPCIAALHECAKQLRSMGAYGTAHCAALAIEQCGPHPEKVARKLVEGFADTFNEKDEECS